MAPPTLPFLPHEIMLNILSHLLVTSPGSYFEDPMNGVQSSWNALDLDPTILQTCSQVYEVGIHLLYSSNKSEFFSAAALYRFTGGINQLVWNSHWVMELALSMKVFEPYEFEEWKDWCSSGHLNRFYPSLKKLVIDLPDNNPGRRFMVIKATSYPEYGQMCEALAANVRAPVVRFLAPSHNEDGVDGETLVKDMERTMSTDHKVLQAEYDKEERLREANWKRWEEIP